MNKEIAEALGDLTIHPDVLQMDINMTDKLVLALIRQLTARDGLCRISEGQMADYLGISERTAARAVASLRKAGLVEFVAGGSVSL